MEEAINMSIFRKMIIKEPGFIPVGRLPPKNILEVFKKNK